MDDIISLAFALDQVGTGGTRQAERVRWSSGRTDSDASWLTPAGEVENTSRNLVTVVTCNVRNRSLEHAWPLAISGCVLCLGCSFTRCENRSFHSCQYAKQPGLSSENQTFAAKTCLTERRHPAVSPIEELSHAGP